MPAAIRPVFICAVYLVGSLLYCECAYLCTCAQVARRVGSVVYWPLRSYQFETQPVVVSWRAQAGSCMHLLERYKDLCSQR